MSHHAWFKTKVRNNFNLKTFVRLENENVGNVQTEYYFGSQKRENNFFEN